MIDTHCHIVFGVDDGSDCAEESIEMARIAINSGITDIIATPHCIPGMFENFVGRGYEEGFRRLFTELEAEELTGKLRIHRGMEAFADRTTLECFDRGLLHCMGKTNYLLIECDFGEDPRIFRDILSGLIHRDIRPVIAHPERYFFAQDDTRYLFDYLEMGCVLQLDTDSILGNFGRASRSCALKLLENGAAQLAGSDAHDAVSRTPDMRLCADFVADNFSGEYAGLLFDINPARLLANKPLHFIEGSAAIRQHSDSRRGESLRRSSRFMSDEEYWGI